MRDLVVWFVVAVITAAALLYAPVAMAQEPVVAGVEGKIIAFINGLLPLVVALNGLGLIQKYMPIKVLGYLKDKLIPLFGTVAVFLGAFGGVTPPAQAGIFGDIGSLLSTTGKLTLSYGVAMLASGTFEHFIRPLADKLGLRPNRELVAR